MRLRGLIAGVLHVVLIIAATTGDASPAAINIRQDLQLELPPCAQRCPNVLDCVSNDLACLCTTKALREVENCAQSNCTVRDFLVTKETHRSTCGIPERSATEMLCNSMWTFLAIAILAVVLRLMARSQTMGGIGFGADDWVILTCLLPLIVYDVLLSYASRDGLGKDIWTLQPAKIDSVLRNLWIVIFAYTAVLVGVQVSIIMFYIRIFGDAHPKFRLLCIAIIGVCISTGLAACIGSLFYCSQISLFWHLWDGEHTGNCRTAHVQIFTVAGVNILLDLIILTLPIPKLKNLNVSVARKIGLAATFLVGLITTSASIVRLRYLITWGDSTNPTWDYNDTAMASTYECHLAIICACMPSMANLWQRLRRGRKVSEIQTSKSHPSRHHTSASKEELYPGVAHVPGRSRKSSMRVAISLEDFLAAEDDTNAAELELKQRGVDHANEEIARIQALV